MSVVRWWARAANKLTLTDHYRNDWRSPIQIRTMQNTGGAHQCSPGSVHVLMPAARRVRIRTTNKVVGGQYRVHVMSITHPEIPRSHNARCGTQLCEVGGVCCPDKHPQGWAGLMGLQPRVLFGKCIPRLVSGLRTSEQGRVSCACACCGCGICARMGMENGWAQP